MNDEWRLQIEVEDKGPLVSLGERLDAQELEDELGDAFADRVILPREGPRILAYAARLADRLQAEDLRVVRRWKYIVIGAADEDEAKELAQRLELQAPSGSEVSAEASGPVAWAERPSNPFAIFGGLGG